MDLLEKIDLYIGEEVVSGGATPTSTPGTTTTKIAKFPEKFVVGRRKKKNDEEEE